MMKIIVFDPKKEMDKPGLPDLVAKLVQVGNGAGIQPRTKEGKFVRHALTLPCTLLEYIAKSSAGAWELKLTTTAGFAT